MRLTHTLMVLWSAYTKRHEGGLYAVTPSFSQAASSIKRSSVFLGRVEGYRRPRVRKSTIALSGPRRLAMRGELLLTSGMAL